MPVPTRTEDDRVDLEDLFQRLAVDSLAADALGGDYDRGQGGRPSSIAEAWYKQHVESALKRDLRLGLWQRTKAKSWFRNVFWAGLRLGLLYDLSTIER